MIHPNVPCILITPICPHSLSFRPIVVPAGVEIKVGIARTYWYFLTSWSRKCTNYIIKIFIWVNVIVIILISKSEDHFLCRCHKPFIAFQVTLSPEARGTAMVSFDGRNRQEIHQGVR